MKQITYFLELTEKLEASLHFSEHVERCCEQAHWIYTRGDIHYVQFRPTQWSYHFQERWGKKWIHDFWHPLQSRPI